MGRRGVGALAATALMVLAACGGDDEVTAGADSPPPAPTVAILAPADGATVPRRAAMTIDVGGFQLAPAGEVAPGTGHLHVMVDTECVATGDTIPADPPYQHLDDGANTVDLELDDGPHRVCVQLADGAHRALAATDTVNVTAAPSGL